MEIAKFRLQLSTALERVIGRFWRVRFALRKLTRIAAERSRRLGHELRAQGNALRVRLLARSRKATAAASSKITRAKAQRSIALEQGATRLRQVLNRLGQIRNKLGQVRNRLARRRRSIGEKLQKLAEGCCAREDKLCMLLAARSREAIVAASGKIAKAKGRLAITFQQGTARIRQAQNRLGGLTRSIAKKRQKPPKEPRAREDGLRQLEARPREASVGANKNTKVKTQSPVEPGQWTAHLLEARNPLAGLTRSIAEKPQKLAEELRAREKELRLPEARPRETIVAAHSKVTEAKAQLPIAVGQRTARLERARRALTGLGRNIVDKRQRGRQELSAREGQMRELLENSPDAIAVINSDHCFVTANRRALDLFGVSERNLSQFNIDVFLFRGQIPDLKRNGSSFMGRQERHGQCVIRRVDGSFRAAEFALVMDFLPLQHLCRFYDLCMPQRLTPIQHRIQPGTQHSSPVGQAQ